LDVTTTTTTIIVWLATVVAETVVLTVISGQYRDASTLKPLKQPSASSPRSRYTITPRDDA
jgi:hypothetical protein